MVRRWDVPHGRDERWFSPDDGIHLSVGTRPRIDCTEAMNSELQRTFVGKTVVVKSTSPDKELHNYVGEIKVIKDMTAEVQFVIVIHNRTASAWVKLNDLALLPSKGGPA